MMTNSIAIQALREAGHADGAIHVDADGTRTIRLPGALNMDIITTAASALTAVGIDVLGFGVNLNSPHDDFIGGTIMIAVDRAGDLPTDTRSRMRA
jgi:hypothetical protein